MKKLIYSLFLSTLAIISFNCQKELSNTNTGGLPADPSVKAPITASLQGNVLDENGQPASGVTITAGTKTAVTNNKGYFRINSASLDKNASLVVAEKAGYFKGYRVFSATSGTNNILIKLIKRNLAGTISNNSGGEVSVAGGSKIKLQNGGVMKADGSSYTGDVKVYAAYIDPSSNDIAATVPGSFLATDKDGKMVTLASYGMLAVELESPSGEKLQVKTGSTATLTTAIPASKVATAPASISLWYVDEQTGIWKEEGTAVKSGNSYVGDVKHFSFWNNDISINAVVLSMTLKDANGTPIVYGIVKITLVNAGYGTYGYTDSLGQVSGLVPANQPLLMEVVSNYPCYATAYSQNISPLSTNTNLGVITVTSNSFLSTVKGHVTNCSNADVAGSYVMMYIGNYGYGTSTDANGNFSFPTILCGGAVSTAEVYATDMTAQQQSNSAFVTLTPGIVNVGTLQACGTSTNQYFNYTVDGNSYSITSGQDSLFWGNTYTGNLGYVNSLYGYSTVPNVALSYSFNSNDTLPGVYPLKYLFQVNGYNRIEQITSVNVTITNFPASPARYYEGSMTGQFKDSSDLSTTHTINGTFRVKRVQ